MASESLAALCTQVTETWNVMVEKLRTQEKEMQDLQVMKEVSQKYRGDLEAELQRVNAEIAQLRRSKCVCCELESDSQRQSVAHSVMLHDSHTRMERELIKLRSTCNNAGLGTRTRQ